ncbi:MAG: hypothetical protein HOB51_08655 [Thaumarchaeota archaeon]|nr:hypothetical protein [Nitrososphaerota archaeon]
MKGLCKTECGMTVEYVPHEFSDGFVYYLPRNLDKTIHHCMIIEMEREMWGDPDPNIEKIYRENKDRLNITQEKFIEILDDLQYDPYSFLGDEESDVIPKLRKGKMYELKKYFENQLNTLTSPSFQSRFPTNGNQNETIEMANTPKNTLTIHNRSDWIVTTKPIDELCSLILPVLPTGNGYQLEFLGYLYEIMIRLEDAKKCYELQYECTGEPELLAICRELDKKILERKNTEEVTENIPDILTIDDMRKRIDFTELNIRKYVVELFSNNFTELFKKNPKLKEQCERIRRKREDMMLNFNENSAIDTVGIGSLAYILTVSRGKNRSKSKNTCKVCERSWNENEDIFSESFPKEINCIDDACFVKQGGLVKKIPMELIHNIKSINATRNILAHPGDYDQEMFKKILRQTYATCDTINYRIDEFLKNKQST